MGAEWIDTSAFAGLEAFTSASERGFSADGLLPPFALRGRTLAGSSRKGHSRRACSASWLLLNSPLRTALATRRRAIVRVTAVIFWPGFISSFHEPFSFLAVKVSSRSTAVRAGVLPDVFRRNLREPSSCSVLPISSKVELSFRTVPRSFGVKLSFGARSPNCSLSDRCR